LTLLALSDVLEACSVRRELFVARPQHDEIEVCL
jgi:hypothetical protein